MTNIGLRVPDYLEHIQQAIERIQRYTEDFHRFLQPSIFQVAPCDPGSQN